MVTVVPRSLLYATGGVVIGYDKECGALQWWWWWCGLLGPRPRGGMCRTPPTLAGQVYSTPVWSELLQILSDHVCSRIRTSLRSRLLYPCLVWSCLLRYFLILRALVLDLVVGPSQDPNIKSVET